MFTPALINLVWILVKFHKIFITSKANEKVTKIALSLEVTGPSPSSTPTFNLLATSTDKYEVIFLARFTSSLTQELK